MLRRSRHRDAQSDSLNDTVETRRSCTPEREESRPQPQSTPQKEKEVNTHHVMTKFKSIINEIVNIISNPTNTGVADDFITVCEEGLRGMKTARVETRNILRRLSSNALPVPRTAVPDDQPLAPVVQVEESAPAAPQNAGEPTGGEASSFRPRSFLAAARGHNSVSPMKCKIKPQMDKSTPPPEMSKKVELEKRALNESVTDHRDGAALRSEERRRHADERRKELQDDKLAKLEVTAEKAAQAKQRRDAAAERVRQGTQTRVESASRRADEHKEKVKEKAQKSTSRTDEVLMVHDLSKENKALKIEMKMSEVEQLQEQRREEQRQAAKDRNEAHHLVIERQRDMSQQRVEKQQQREQQRLDNLKRLEEQKRIDNEAKHQKAGEREKKIIQQQQAAHAEAEAARKKAEERISQSAQLREEQRAQQKQKLEKQDQKVKEAKERRDKDEPSKPTFHDVMPAAPAQDDEQATARLVRSLTATSRHSKTFVDAYQKENLLTTKDINKSRLRPIVTRLQTFTAGTNLTQSRQPLHDLSLLELSEVDHEYMRYYNGHEVVVKLMIDAKKTHDAATFKLCNDVLHKLLLDPIEGSAHARYFVRAGHLVPLVIIIHEEIKALRKHNRSNTLTVALSLVQLCVSVIVTESQTSAKLATIREQVITDLDTAGADKFCFAIASTCVDEEDMPSLQYALLLLQSQVAVLSKKKMDSQVAAQWIRSAVTSLFTFLQNVLTPGGQPLKPQHVISPKTSCVIFTALRVLNAIARWKLDTLQEVLRGEVAKDDETSPSALRTELFHIVHSFLLYIGSHEMERIPPNTSEQQPSDVASKSFQDALNFGLTLNASPRLPLGDTTVSARSTSEAVFFRASLHEILLFAGYVTLCDAKMQEIFSWGKERPLLTMMLSALPMPYFSLCKHALFPTLASIVFGDERNRLILQRMMDKSQLVKFLREEFEALPPKVKALAAQFNSAQEAAAAAADESTKGQAAPSQTEPAAVAKKSWADMDDDDDDCGFGLPQPKAADTTSAVAPPAPDSRQSEKERLARVFKTAAPAQAAHFYRLDRRFPPALWLAAAAFTEQEAQDTTQE